MNKLKLLSMIPALCLASCSKSTYIGVYEFRLGKTDGAHFGLSVELKDEAYEGIEGMKKIQMVADLGNEIDINSLDASGDEEGIDAKLIIKAFLDLLPEEDKANHRITIDGYYELLPNVVSEKYGTRVKIGSNFIQELIDKSYPEVGELIDLSTIITPERIELVACAYVDNKQFTLQIPVSEEDLQQQLAWYGYLFDLEAISELNFSRILVDLDQDKLPGSKRGEDRVGVHPVQDDSKGIHEVSDMNEVFEFDFSRTYLYDYDGFIYEPVGSFVTRLNDKGQKVLYFDMFEGEMPATLNAYIYDGSYKEVEFGAGALSKEVTNVTYTYPEDGKDTITFKNDVTVTFKDFVKDPFVFRDFHDVKVGLTKI